MVKNKKKGCQIRRKRTTKMEEYEYVDEFSMTWWI